MIASTKKCILVALTISMVFQLIMSATIRVDAQSTVYSFHYLVPPEPLHFNVGLVMRNELTKIGIEMIIDRAPDWGTYWDITFGEYWNKSWAEGGWDVCMFPWGWHPLDLIWLEASYAAAGMLPRGWNYYSWQNKKADTLLHSAMTTYDIEVRRMYAWKWQEEFMHDPPSIILYHSIGVDIRNAKVQNWHPLMLGTPTLSWDAVGITIQGKTLEDYVTLRIGSNEDLYYLSPMFVFGATDALLASLTFDTLMKAVWDPVEGQIKIVPGLAADYPVYSEDKLHATFRLRDDVYWHDGVKFTAKDVKLTFEATVDPKTKWACAYADFAPYVESVDIIDDYTVRFNLKEPAAHLEALLSNTWGGFIVPEHILGGIPRSEWWRHPTNTDPAQRLPGTGPYKFVQWQPGRFFEVIANENWWGGKPFVDHIIHDLITDPTAMLIALQHNEIDLAQGGTWEATRSEIEDMKTWPNLKVTEYFAPGAAQFDINLLSGDLGNRYLRLAIAHAIPYEDIINTVLEGYGYRGKTPILPFNAWGAFNTEIPYYEHNLTKAQQYLDMWKYSKVGTDYTKGPKGDADLSGLVELPDFYIWVSNFGTTPDKWPRLGHIPIDPDFDNTGYVDMYDFYRWREAWGTRYPFPGAR